MRPLLFDLDGVLVDSRRPIARSINFALERLGLSAQPEAELHPFIGPPLIQAFRELLTRLDADPGRAEACVAHYRQRYARRCVEETRTIAGIEPVVRRLAKERPIAVATSKPAHFAEPILAGLGLRPLFRAVVGPGLDPEAEPKSATVRRALAALDLAPPSADDPQRPALIGDRLHDVEAAHANALLAVGVTWGIGSESELRAAGADVIVHHPDALLEIL